MTPDEPSSSSGAPSTSASLKVASRWFVAVASLTSLLVVILGWTTDLRDLMHGALLAVCVFALFPFVIIAGLLALVLTFALVGGLVFAALGADDAPPDGLVSHVADGFVWASQGITPYYRWLARHHRSPLLGIPAGLLSGGLLLWAALAIIVLPREAKTTEHLLMAQAAIEQAYREAHQYPSPIDEHLLVPEAATSALADALGPEGQLIDAFGRPVLYRVKGHWPRQSYRLRSLGYDGLRGGDDLCVSGQTKLQKILDAVSTLGALLASLNFESMKWTDRLQHVASATCLDDL